MDWWKPGIIVLLFVSGFGALLVSLAWVFIIRGRVLVVGAGLAGAIAQWRDEPRAAGAPLRAVWPA